MNQNFNSMERHYIKSKKNRILTSPTEIVFQMLINFTIPNLSSIGQELLYEIKFKQVKPQFFAWPTLP